MTWEKGLKRVNSTRKGAKPAGIWANPLQNPSFREYRIIVEVDVLVANPGCIRANPTRNGAS